MRGRLSGTPQQTTTLWDMLCGGGGGRLKPRETLRDGNKERIWFIHCSAYCELPCAAVSSWFKPYLRPRVLWSRAHPSLQADRPSNGLSGLARLKRKRGQEGRGRWCLIADSFATFWLKIHQACWSKCFWGRKKETDWQIVTLAWSEPRRSLWRLAIAVNWIGRTGWRLLFLLRWNKKGNKELHETQFKTSFQMFLEGSVCSCTWKGQ